MMTTMKKYIIYMAAALLFAGCSKDAATDQPQPVVGEPLQFSAVSGAASRTETTVDEAGLLQITWMEEDQVGIYATSNGNTSSANYAYVATPSKTDATHCTFSAVNEEEMVYWLGTTQQGFYAYLPYQEVVGEYPTPEHHPIALASIQKQASANSAAHLSTYGTMVSQPVEVAANELMGGGVQFGFSHLFSVVEFRLKSTPDCPLAELPIKELTLTATAGALSYPAAHVNLTAPITAEQTPQLTADEESASVTLQLAEAANLKRDVAQSFYMLVAPGMHAADGLTLEVKAIDNSVYTVVIPEAVTFRSNKHYVREYALALDGFEQADPFEVDIPVLTTSVGKPLQVNLSGVADQVDFWSGELFHDYAYVATDRMMPATVQMEFKFALVNGAQREPTRIKVSRNFDGTMTEEAILAADWTDVTDEFEMYPTPVYGLDPEMGAFSSTQSTPFAKGPVVCDAWFGDDERIYVMFHYHILKNDTSWVDPITQSNKSQLGRTYFYLYDCSIWSTPYGMPTQTMLYEQLCGIVKGSATAKPYFPEVEGAPTLVLGSTIGSSDWNQPQSYSYTVGGVSYPYVYRLGTEFKPSVDKDLYVVLPLIERPEPANLGPDQPIVLQAAGANTPSAWSYTFEKAGSYHVVIVGTVKTLAGEKQVVKEFTVEVSE